ncbi:LysR family transcriptional regulator [Sphaerisporangium melleum]|uniref:LysR family transcriptional regulator n=1 Tax=Sphaerisporangium melleum TaxID=321316 RepID=A0A917RE61_9ACTN|nr:LysR family transcriptional regulator [Sphaerisporangium melleum]GGL02124.1 LysR family transcriptional regulator [Sphaerisporangium melleum]GII72215.1 LysR family transcriptional regulator [Sphaerisporangium melleum]
MEPTPTLREIDCFARVARTLSFSRAAADLNLSQPAMSQAIGRAERSLGVRLFDRTSREVRLSPAGQALLPYAEALLETAAALHAEAGRLATPRHPAIRLAYAPPAGSLVAQAARRLSRRRPAIDVDLRPTGRRAALQALTNGEVAAALLPAPFPTGYTTSARFGMTITHLAIPTGDPLTGTTAVKPTQLAAHKVLMPHDRPRGGMWATLAATLHGPHQHRLVAEEIDDFAALLDLVAAGTGVLPVPRLLATSVKRPDVTFVPFQAGELRITYGIAWSPDQATPELITLINTVQEALWTR